MCCRYFCDHQRIISEASENARQCMQKQIELYWAIICLASMTFPQKAKTVFVGCCHWITFSAVKCITYVHRQAQGAVFPWKRIRKYSSRKGDIILSIYIALLGVQFTSHPYYSHPTTPQDESIILFFLQYPRELMLKRSFLHGDNKNV